MQIALTKLTNRLNSLKFDNGKVPLLIIAAQQIISRSVDQITTGTINPWWGTTLPCHRLSLTEIQYFFRNKAHMYYKKKHNGVKCPPRG